MSHKRHKKLPTPRIRKTRESHEVHGIEELATAFRSFAAQPVEKVTITIGIMPLRFISGMLDAVAAQIAKHKAEEQPPCTDTQN